MIRKEVKLKSYILCKDCPRFKDTDPQKKDVFGNHYGICGMGGNMVYPQKRKIKRIKGKGYIYYGPSSCGMYASIQDALKDMTIAEILRSRSI